MKNRLCSIMLCVALVMSLLGNSGYVLASSEESSNYYDISTYRYESGYTYPLKEGYMFAGWYEDADFKTPIKDMEQVTGKAYAKFVDEGVLQIKYQLSEGTTIDSANTNLRIVTTVDSLAYRQAGFRIKVGNTILNYTTDNVYETLYGYVNEEKTAYEPSGVFSKESKFFLAHRINGIPNSDFGVPITITPVWMTLDGTVVSGDERTISINEVLGKTSSGTGNETSLGFTGVQTWSAPSTVKIAQDNTGYTPKGEASLSYNAVRNEYESQQLVLTASRDVQNYDIQISDLVSETNTLSKENIAVYNQKYITYAETNGHYNGDQTVSMPDALIPLDAAREYGELTIAANNNAAFWITVYVPKNTPAGTYTGTFVLEVEGQYQNVPVTVKVNNYTLPDTTTAKTMFSWRYDRVGAGELNSSIELMESYYEFFADYRISLQSLPIESLTGEELIKALDKYYDTLTTYTILSAPGKISLDILADGSKREKTKEQIFAIAAASTTERNLFDKAIFNILDEPSTQDEASVNYIIERIDALDQMLEECVQEIKADTTGKYTEFKKIPNWETSIKEIPNLVTLTDVYFQKLLTNYNEPWMKELLSKLNCLCMSWYNYNDHSRTEDKSMYWKEAIDMVYNDYPNITHEWWYGGWFPMEPKPNYHISSTNLLSSRTNTWVQKKFGIEGTHNWDAAAYTSEVRDIWDQYQNVYENPIRHTHLTAGDGNLAYPGAAYGKEGPFPSLRLMSIRDGLEEHEMLTDLENSGASIDSYIDKVSYKRNQLRADGETWTDESSNTQTLYFDEVRADIIDALIARGLRSSIEEVAETDKTPSEDERTSVATEGYSSSADSMQYLIGEDELDIAVKSKQLLGFESYEEITGTKIRVGNQLGEMAINKDEDFITEGQGSLMIRPQGDYNDRAQYPYFQLDFLDSTCGTNNFSKLREISFDAYNCQTEELRIRVSFTLTTEDGSQTKTPLKTFTLKPNGWTHCAYELSEMINYTYYDFTNVRYMTFEFLDYKESKTDTLNELYIDNLVGMYYVSESEKQDVTYDFKKGITFETSAEQYVISGDSNINTRMDFSRIAYTDENMEVAAKYGAYGMKADAIGSVFPTFTMRYGETLPAGTSLCFMAYIDTEAGEDTTPSRIESLGNTVFTQNLGFNRWFEVEILLNADTDTTRVFFNLDDGTGKSILDYNQPITIYMDNLKIYEPDIEAGLTFEYSKDAGVFARLWESGAEWTDATIERVTYASEGISAAEDGGNYALKLSHTEYSFPRFEIKFGEELPAGTKLTFMAYGIVNGVEEGKPTRFEASHASTGKAVVTSTEDTQEGGVFTVGKWTEITVTLIEAAESVQMFWNFAITEVGNNGSGAVYIDNFKAHVPSPFIAGVDFEVEKHTALFDGWKEVKDGVDYSWADAAIDRITYADAGISAPTDGGTYGLKLSHATFGCPRLEINFGETLPEETTITFWAYGVVDGASEGARTRFIPSGISTGKVVVTSTEDIQESGLFTLGQWTQITITLSEATETVQVFCDYEVAGTGCVGTMYVDNFKATLPPEDFIDGVGFENEADASLISSSYTEESNNIALSRVKYTDEDMTVSGAYGLYAIKGDVTGKVYPRFTLHYEEEFPVGTTLDFWIYIKTNAAVDENTTIRLERVKSEGWPEAFENVGFNQWVKITFTLDEATETSDIFFNLDDGTGSSIFGQETVSVYFDNFKTELSVVGKFIKGVGFEETDQENAFDGWKEVKDGVDYSWADATIDRITYADAGISAPTDGGDYVIKLSNDGFGCPRFEINFSETLPAGTTITCWAYGVVDGAAEGARTRFIPSGTSTGKAVITSTEDTQESGLFTLEQWTQITITLSEAAETVQVFCDFDVVSSGSVGTMYADNFKAVLPE